MDERANEQAINSMLFAAGPQIKELEAQVAALKKQLQTANKELALWRSEHDPCPFALENERLTEQVRVLKQNAEDLRDSVLNQRGSLAENGMTNDQVNDVLAEIDDAFFAQSAAPRMEGSNGHTADCGRDTACRADTNLGELNRISQDNAWLREQLRVRSQPVSRAEVERSYRGSGWIGFANRFNQIIAARSAAPGKEGEDAGGINV